MIFSVLTPDGQLGFASNEGTNAVQTYAFEGGVVQLRYGLDGVIESRAFIDDSWTEWNPLVTAAGEGLEADSSGTVSVDNTVVRTTRSVTAGTGLTGGGDLSADRSLSVDDTVIRRLSGHVEATPNMTYLERQIQWGPANEPSYLLVGPLDTIGRSLAGSFYGARDENSGGVSGVTIDLSFKSGSSNNDFRATAVINYAGNVINYAGKEGDTPVLNTATFDGQEWLAINFLQTGYYQPDRFFFRGLVQNVEILNAPATLVTNVQPYDGDGSLVFNNAEVVTTSTRLQHRTVTNSTTLTLGDVDSVVEVNSSSSRTITVPTNASVAFPIGSVIEIVRWGTGTVIINPANGVTVRSPDGETGARNIASQYGSAFLRKRAVNEWHLSGDLE